MRNNAISGKLVEYSMIKVDVKIVATRKQNLKWSFRPPLNRKQFRNRAIAIEKEKCRINLSKTIYIRANLLDLSKVLM